MASPMGTRRASRTAVEVETSDADEKIAQLTRQKRELAAELTNKDRIIAELTHKLESETRNAQLLESELSLTTAAMQQAEVTHGTELGRLEGDVARVLAERRPLLEKLQSIEAVEDAVRELYLQMKERTAERIAPNLGQLEAERQALKKENILVVLGRLKGNLKNLWAFKLEAETDMRARKTEEKAASEDKMKGVYSRLSQMENQVMEERGKADAVRSQMAAQQRINQRLQAESSAAVARMQEAHGTLLAEIEELQAENEKLRDALRTAIAEGRSRDRILLRNKQLESSTHFERVKMDRELRSLQSVHNRELQVIDDHVNEVEALRRENEAVKSKLVDAQAEVAALKSNLDVYTARSLEETVKRLRLVIAEKEGREKALEADNSRLRGKADYAQQQLERIAAEAGIQLPPGSRDRGGDRAGGGGGGGARDKGGLAGGGGGCGAVMSSGAVMRAAQRGGVKKKVEEDSDNPAYANNLLVNVHAMRSEARSGIKGLRASVNAAQPSSREVIKPEELYVSDNMPKPAAGATSQHSGAAGGQGSRLGAGHGAGESAVSAQPSAVAAPPTASPSKPAVEGSSSALAKAVAATGGGLRAVPLDDDDDAASGKSA